MLEMFLLFTLLMVHIYLFKETHEENASLSGADVNPEECWERVSVKVEVKE
jgi:hypothetical protein